jgi:signal peptidase
MSSAVPHRALPGGSVLEGQAQARPGGRFGARSVVGLLLSVALLAAGWWFLAPAPLGGSTAFVTVDGASMQPRLHRSDLVIVRAASAYEVGDVVAYRSRLLGRVVLHRIVAVRDGRYVLKGDNNDFLDPEQPARSAFVGKELLHVPRAGLLVEAARTPPIAALIAVALVLAAGLGGRAPRGVTPGGAGTAAR